MLANLGGCSQLHHVRRAWFLCGVQLGKTPPYDCKITIWQLELSQSDAIYSQYVRCNHIAFTCCRSPQLTVFLAGGGYLVFLVLFLPLYAISFILTAAGAWAVLVGVVYAGGRGLTQTISYPGQSKQIQRELETEYTKVVSARLVRFATKSFLF